MNTIKIKILLSLCLFLTGFCIKAQQVIEIQPLFEYPVAPEELTTLTDKSEYVVTHFWEPLDTKNQQAVVQMALDHAFEVFSSAVKWSKPDVANQAVDKLLSRVSGNPTLLYQLTKSAERYFYSPNADFWPDDLYLKFIDATLKNKKISDRNKEKYRKQAQTLRNTKVDNTAPKFDFEEADGKISSYFPMSTPTLLIFGDPEDTDWRMARLRLETNTALSQALDKGKINILYIVDKTEGDWKNTVSNYPSNWKVGKGIDLDSIYDIRLNPTIYLIGSDGKIKDKYMLLETAVTQVLESVQ